VAEWYAEWVGEAGSFQHRQVTIPAVLELLALRRGEQVLDIGAGPGLLAPAVARAGARAGAHYTGVDASIKRLTIARRRHGRSGRFLLGDVLALPEVTEIRAGSFDAAVFLLSIQDMDPLPDVLRCMAWAPRGGGRVVMVMTHPCFRVPRLSGWGWDERRHMHYRRVDRYLTPMPVPMATAGLGSPATVRIARSRNTSTAWPSTVSWRITCWSSRTSRRTPTVEGSRESTLPFRSFRSSLACGHARWGRRLSGCRQRTSASVSQR
jgi:SAM-dependent methyltransferase